MKIAAILLLISASAVIAEPQYGYYPSPFGYYPPSYGYYSPQRYNYPQPEQHNYFRSGAPQSSLEQPKEANEGRFFFTTLTATIATSTSTTTSTITTTCTTSTKALSVCIGSGGRRRRGASVASGLYFNEDDESGIFLPSPEKTEEPVAVEKEERIPRKAPAPAPSVPFVIEPGYKVPEGLGANGGRFLLAFGTTTTTTTSTTTFISTLTAICKSTTLYQTCGSTGK